MAEKLKHFSAHAAIDRHLSSALPQELTMSGQQSCMFSMAAISAISADFGAPTAPLVAGSIATEKATKNAKMVRAIHIENQMCS